MNIKHVSTKLQHIFPFVLVQTHKVNFFECYITGNCPRKLFFHGIFFSEISEVLHSLTKNSRTFANSNILPRLLLARTSHTLELCTRWRCVINFTLRPTLLLGKETRYHWIYLSIGALNCMRRKYAQINIQQTSRSMLVHQKNVRAQPKANLTF
jgi:hypothetical protein